MHSNNTKPWYAPPSSVLPPALASDIRDSFRRYDRDGKGHLKRHEARCAIASLVGRAPTKVEVNNLLMSAPDGKLTSEGFFKYAADAIRAAGPDERIRQAFKAFDTQGVGYITRADLQRICAQYAPWVSDKAVMEVFEAVDSDGDGRLSCREFDNMMRMLA